MRVLKQELNWVQSGQNDFRAHIKWQSPQGELADTLLL